MPGDIKPSEEQIVDSIVEHVRKQRASGTLKPGDRAPSEWEIARRFDASRATVKNAYDILVEQKVLLRRPGVGTFISTPLKRKKANDISFIHYDEDGHRKASFDFSIIYGIEEGAEKNGIRLSLILLGPKDSEKIAREKIQNGIRNTDGIIVSSQIGNSVMAIVEKTHMPFVTAGNYLPGKDYDAVAPDNPQGAYDMVSFLAETGHARIVFLYPDSGGDRRFSERLSGYRRYFEANGMFLDGDLSAKYRGPKNALGEISRLGADAVFCANDWMAAEFIEEATRSGIRIPDDISVAGFENRDFAAFISPQLTSVEIPSHEIGKLAVETLLSRISSPDAPPAKTLARTRLKLRASHRDRRT